MKQRIKRLACNETIGFIEAKEMTHYAITQPAITTSVSSLRKTTQKPSGIITCNICSKSTKKFVWSSKNKKYIECSACKQWRIKSRKKVDQSDNKYADETNAFLVDGLYTQNFDKAVDVCDYQFIVSM